MIASSILNPITFKNVPTSNTYPNMWNTLHATRTQGNNKIIPYYQKFQKDHTVYLQFESDVANDIVLKSYCGTSEIESFTESYDVSYGSGANIRYYTNFVVVLDNTSPGYYNKKVWFKATQVSDILTSEPIFIYDLAPEILKGTIKYIKYTNLDRIESDLDDRFIDWSILPAGNVGKYLDFFVEAIDIDPNDTDESEVLEGSQSKTILSAVFYSGRVLKTGGIPDYMAARLGMASSLDIFTVNGIQYIKSGEIGQDRFGGSTLYQVSMKLTQKNAIGINVDNLGITEIVVEPPIAGTKMYVGSVTSATPNETAIKLMTEKAALEEDETEVYTITDARPCFAYPTSFGALVSILDTTGFEIISGFNITTLTFTNTVGYTIYTLKRLATLDTFTIIFKFT